MHVRGAARLAGCLPVSTHSYPTNNRGPGEAWVGPDEASHTWVTLITLLRLPQDLNTI